jgi:hypothetical protein
MGRFDMGFASLDGVSTFDTLSVFGFTQWK